MTADGSGDSIGVLLVDDHRLVLAGLASLIDQAPGMHVVGLASDGEQALEVAQHARPDVVLMDLSMPGPDGVETTARLLEMQPEARVVVLTSFSDRHRILDAVEAGAAGYLLKDSDPDDLLRGIRAAARGESPLDSRVAREVLRGRLAGRAEPPGPRHALPSGPPQAPVHGATAPGRPGRAAPAAELTAREREVLLLVRQGLANKQIATRLGITSSTVKAHLSSAFQRIGVADRTSAALYAQRHLVDDHAASPYDSGSHTA